MPITSYYKIVAVLPLDNDQSQNASLLPYKAREVCSSLNPIIELFQKSDPIGRTGDYTGVFGLNLRSGGYVADENANPQKGQVGSSEEGLCYEFITYARGDTEIKTIETFADKLAALHPWEQPTIEISAIDNWEPA